MKYFIALIILSILYAFPSISSEKITATFICKGEMNIYKDSQRIVKNNHSLTIRIDQNVLKGEYPMELDVSDTAVQKFIFTSDKKNFDFVFSLDRFSGKLSYIRTIKYTNGLPYAFFGNCEVIDISKRKF